MTDKLSLNDCTHCIAVPGQDTAIDLVHPITGRTIYGNKTLAEIKAERPEYADAELLPFDEFSRQVAERQHSPIKWEATTEEAYTYGLEVLPPAAWVRGGFLVGEPYDHDAGNGQPRFQAFRHKGDQYEKANRPMTRAEFRQAMANDNQQGTHENPIRYEHIKPDDPNRQEKLAKQRQQFEDDAKAGNVVCLSDLMISHGL